MLFASDRSPARPALLAATAAALALVGASLAARSAGAQTVFHACYVPASGTVYRIKATNTPQNCLQPTHVAFSWTDGADAAAALQNAVKKTDAAAGDVTGVFSSLTVGKLLGRALAATPPTDGQVLAWNATTSTWEPKTVAAGGGGGVTDHGALTGLGDDDHSQYALASGSRPSAGFALTGQVSGGLSALPVSGGGTRMLWFPERAAFRAGNVSADQWDLPKLGLFSVGLGLNVIASGGESVALGRNAQATGENSFAFGSNGSGATLASGSSAVAIGGVNTASGARAMIFGQSSTASAEDALALGRSANATHMGSVVIGAKSSSISSSRSDQFVVGALHVWMGNATNAVHTTGRFLETSTGGYLTTGGAWTNHSDSTVKTAFLPVDGDSVLAKLAELTVYTWQYKAEDSTTRHMGPTAQSFRKAFGLGDTEKAISTVDIDGVALAGVKALEARTKSLKAETIALRQENADLAARVAQLEALVSQLVVGASKDR